ncbi:50S ribosomal protein L19e [Candidatus Bathyarchaeota archaeon]|nr:MAG: 50S ribosomal protein L19e [Candidatus Bathyarchaeota archaeon]
MSLRTQRRLAAEILKVGVGRVWIDPEYIDEVATAITREEIRRFIHEGIIRAKPEKGISRARARYIHAQKKKGRRRGPGTRSAGPKARLSKKRRWILRIRAIRRYLRMLRDRKAITVSTYRKLYMMASGGAFKSRSDLKRYITTHELWRK